MKKMNGNNINSNMNIESETSSYSPTYLQSPNAQYSGDGKFQEKVGVTQSIRKNLNFQDEKLWKKFSARRLELIDTLDLSSKKASEQDEKIRKVSETLRIEFEYSDRHIGDFDKLVRAAIQSVRRNRKRSSKSRNHNGSTKFVMNIDKNFKTGSSNTVDNFGNLNNYKKSEINKLRSYNTILSQNTSNIRIEDSDKVVMPVISKNEDDTDPGTSIKRQRFISEITRLNSDSGEDLDNHPNKHIQSVDNSKLAIDSIITPKFLKEKNKFFNGDLSSNFSSSGSSTLLSSSSSSLVLPPISTLTLTASTTPRAQRAKSKVLSYIERSKTCQESITRHTPILENLGENTIITAISFVFEKFFSELNLNSIDYLKTKLLSKYSMSKLFKSFDNSTYNLNLSESESCTSLFVLIGGCIKDFGFDSMIYPLSEIIHEIILRDYPLISNQIDLKSGRSMNDPNANSNETDEVILNVKLIFLNNVLNFTYSNRSSPPKLIELIENGKNAFNIVSNFKINLKDLNSGLILNSDNEIERIFKSSTKIEFELIILNNEILINDLNRRNHFPSNGISLPEQDQTVTKHTADHTLFSESSSGISDVSSGKKRETVHVLSNNQDYNPLGRGQVRGQVQLPDQDRSQNHELGQSQSQSNASFPNYQFQFPLPTFQPLL